MNSLNTLTLGLTLGVAAMMTAGCQPELTLEDKGQLNRATHEYHLVEAAEAAVIRQRTIFPYHFEADTAELNDLGRRDIDTLARHFENRDGTLHVRRGGASDQLYEARVSAVSARMTAEGVSMGHGRIDDGLPGGDGMTSERVLLVRDRVPEWNDSDGNGDIGDLLRDSFNR